MKNVLRLKTFAFYAVALTFALYVFSFLLPSVLSAEEPNVPGTEAVGIKWVHIFIRADVNQVHFENIWVFERQAQNRPWQVSINLPDGAAALSFDEPNETEFATEPGTIRKRMAADSLIDSAGFSFVLPNQDGMCRTLIKPSYRVGLMVVSVSGPATQLESRVLRANEFMQSHSRFSGVYTAGDMAADTEVEINLARLPRRDRGLLEIACVAGLCLIVIIALLTVCWNRYAFTRG